MDHRRGDALYIIQSAVTGAVKIGRSKDPNTRLRQLQTGSPHRLRLLAYFPGEGQKERGLHELCRRHRLKGDGEWFHYDCLNELPDPYYSALPEDDRWWVRPKP